MLVQEHPDLLEDDGRERVQMFSAFFLQGVIMVDDSACAQAAFWCSQDAIWRTVFQLMYSKIWDTDR